MKIVGMDCYIVPMQWQPHFAVGKAASYVRPPVMDAVIIQLHTDEGITGIGEATPVTGVFGETPEGIVAILRQFITHIKGRDPMDVGEIHAIMDRLSRRSNFSAKCAVDMALYDIIGKKFNVPAYKLLGGLQRDKVATHISIASSDAETMAADAIETVNKGFSIIKVKVEGDGTTDLERILTVLEAVDGKATLAVDVNEGWNVPDTIRIARHIIQSPKYVDNVILEQPIVAHDLDGMSYITRTTPIPILADESAWTISDVLEVVRRKAADIITIKIVETCGLYGAMQAAAIAEAGNVKYVIDECCDTKIANTAVAHAAFAAGSLLHYSGCCNHLLYENNIVTQGGVTITDGHAFLDDTPGLGIKELSLDEFQARKVI